MEAFKLLTELRKFKKRRVFPFFCYKCLVRLLQFKLGQHIERLEPAVRWI